MQQTTLVRSPVCTVVLAVLIDDATRRPTKRSDPMLLYETTCGRTFHVTPRDAAETMFYREYPTGEVSVYLPHTHSRQWWQQHIEAASVKADALMAQTSPSPSPTAQPWGWGSRWEVSEADATTTEHDGTTVCIAETTAVDPAPPPSPRPLRPTKPAKPTSTQPAGPTTSSARPLRPTKPAKPTSTTPAGPTTSSARPLRPKPAGPPSARPPRPKPATLTVAKTLPPPALNACCARRHVTGMSTDCRLH